MPYSPRQLKRILDPELIPAGDYPARVRVAESLIKRTTFALEDRTVTALAAKYRAALGDIRGVLYGTADRLGIRTLQADANGRAWRSAVQAPIAQRIDKLTDDTAALALRAATTAWYGGYVGRAWLLDTNTPDDTRIHVRQVARSDVARWMASLVDVREDEYSDTISSLLGRQWREQFAAELDTVTAALKRAIWNGMAAGEGIPEIITRVEDVLGSYASSGYTANFARTQTLVRTVVNQASNNGAMNVFRDNPEVLTGYQWLTASDERVCPTCAALNGTTYAMSDYFRPPAHPNCRCTIIPVIRYADESLSNNVSTLPTLDAWAVNAGLAWMIDEFTSSKAPIGDEYETIGFY